MNAARVVAIAAAGLAFAACAVGPAGSTLARPADTGRVVRELAAAVDAWLGMLSPEQLRLAQHPLDDPEVAQWAFVPGRYAGLELGALAPAQHTGAFAVVHAMVGAGGLARTQAVLRLEEVLREQERVAGLDVSHRDPGRYALLVCGEPDEHGTYVVRFQGHHVSLRIAVVDGLLAGFTPHFLGANPHRLPATDGPSGDGPAGDGPAGDRPAMGAGDADRYAEEELARDLMAGLDDAQRERACIAANAPADVLLGPGRGPDALGPRLGLPIGEMHEQQERLLWRLLEVYARRCHPAIAEAELARIRREDADVLTFAWAGSLQPGEGHYYRIHGRHFAIEYDNTQNGANHVHTVWRDFDRDFGGDPLREHLQRVHGQ